MNPFWQDLKFGARMLAKRKGFAATAVITLALGIGATTAIFSALEAILFRALPLPAAERLVLFTDSTHEGTSTGDPMSGVWTRFSFASYRHFGEHLKSFESLAAFRSGEARLALRDEGALSRDVQLTRGDLVSGNYFSVLGAGALLGRTLTAADDAETAPPAAVVSYACWQRIWGGNPAVVGRPVSLNDRPFTIVGVMPRSFFGIQVRRAPDVWLPLRFQPEAERVPSLLAIRDAYWLNLVGRLRPGADLASAQVETDVAFRQMLADQAGPHPTPEWSRAIEHAAIRLAPGARGISFLREAYGAPIVVLMVVTALVLLIACANVANLLLSRALERRAEITMRIALGAGRARLVRMLLTESLLLAALGGIAGLVLALWGMEALKIMVLRSAPIEVGLSLPVLAFAAAASVLAGFLFGLAPALRVGRGDLASMLRSRSDPGGGRLRTGLATTLVVAQVAISLVLLVGSGLLVRSLVNLARTDLGFARDGVVLVDIDTRLSGLKPAETGGYYQRLVDRAESVAGVRAASVAAISPMSGSSSTSNISIAGYAPAPGEDMLVGVNRVGPGYAQVLGLPLLRGREFDRRDSRDAPKVALVNQAFARAFFKDGDPVGRRVGFGDNPAAATTEIVGVLGDARYDDPKEAPTRMLFLPLLQERDETAFIADLEVRTTLDPAGVIPALRQAVTEVDPRVPIAAVATLDAQVDGSLRTERLFARLVGGFGALALVLACIGLYGVVSRAVTRRTNEVGIRMALGAGRSDIVLMILREAGWLVAIGLAIGIPASAAASRLIASQLFGVTPADPAIVALASLALAAIAILAGYLPARRASRLDPNEALRTE